MTVGTSAACTRGTGVRDCEVVGLVILQRARVWLLTECASAGPCSRTGNDEAVLRNGGVGREIP